MQEKVLRPEDAIIAEQLFLRQQDISAKIQQLRGQVKSTVEQFRKAQAATKQYAQSLADKYDFQDTQLDLQPRANGIYIIEAESRKDRDSNGKVT